MMQVENKIDEDLILCKCGCGTLINKTDKYGRKHYFVHGHQTRRQYSGTWKGGRYKDCYGYIQIHKPDHHFANNRGGKAGYIAEHRLVWEEYHKACLLPYGNIHHINEIKDDNRPENLQVMSNSDHVTQHLLIDDMYSRYCNTCGSTTTDIVRRKCGLLRPTWYTGILSRVMVCSKCYRKEYHIFKRKGYDKT